MSNQNEIISQLRVMRIHQRVKLADEFYESFANGLTAVLAEVNKEYDEIHKKYDIANKKYCESSTLFENGHRKEKDRLYELLNQCAGKRSFLHTNYETGSERNLKLRDFDIETERIILEAMCGTKQICSNDKVIPQLMEEPKKENETIVEVVPE